MITQEQEKWLERLSVEEKVKIVDFDPTAEQKFQKLKDKIQSHLGKEIEVFHRGSTYLGIAGQDEIDVYIPTTLENFDKLLPSLQKLFGEARSVYPGERIRFSTQIEGKKIDLFLINKNHQDWLNGLKFENYLLKNLQALADYQDLKKRSANLSIREYYREKTEFINKVLTS